MDRGVRTREFNHNTPKMKRLASALTDENLLSGDQSTDSEQEEAHFIF